MVAATARIRVSWNPFAGIHVEHKQIDLSCVGSRPILVGCVVDHKQKIIDFQPKAHYAVALQHFYSEPKPILKEVVFICEHMPPKMIKCWNTFYEQIVRQSGRNLGIRDINQGVSVYFSAQIAALIN